MNLGLTGVLRGLPALVGVLAGIANARPPVQPSFALPILLLFALVLLSLLSRKAFTSYPRISLVLLEPWVFLQSASSHSALFSSCG